MTIEYFLADDQKYAEILTRIQKTFQLKEEVAQICDESYYDTFGWLLYENGYVLKREKKTLYLLDFNDGNILAKSPFRSSRFFSWDVNENEMRLALEPLTDIRAVIEMASINMKAICHPILNGDRKIVARLHAEFLDSTSDTDDRKEVFLHLSAIRGYKKEYNTLQRILRESNLQLSQFGSRFEIALAANGKTITPYSSKFSLSLNRAETVYEAVGKICLSLVGAMKINIDGVIDDIDSEFLHDFRIAIRRTRSLLSQMKNALPPDKVFYFQQEFKWLGEITGPVRDIDVYLLMKKEFHDILPVELHEGLEMFFADLERQRKPLFKRLKSGLTSQRYLALMDDWHTFLTRIDGDEQWPKGDEKCVDLATRFIRKRFKRILKDGGAITDVSEDEMLHRLRIQGKKLRYMLEFFRSFYADDEIDFFLKQLKRLQNNLGDFNDISVQQDMLVAKKRDLTTRTKRSIKIAAALGGLLSHLNDEHKVIRQKFESTFQKFASQDNIDRFLETVE